MRVLVLGAGGFIGGHLLRAILERTDWQVTGMDLTSARVQDLLGRRRLSFRVGDLSRQRHWVDEQIRAADVVIPLAAVATPSRYVQDPLHVFEVTFEENLRIARQCVNHGIRLLYPSSSEVYGLGSDNEFDEHSSGMTYGPVHKERWIYAASKQLLERILWAHASRNRLRCTIFRPFNWIGPGLDEGLQLQAGVSRVVSQFIADLLTGRPLRLVGGGGQRRCYTDVGDGVAALLAIIENSGGRCDGQIFNIGHPGNEASVRDIAGRLLAMFRSHALGGDTTSRLEDASAEEVYGPGYDDMPYRRPAIARARQALGWQPVVDLEEALARVLDASLRAWRRKQAGAVMARTTPDTGDHGLQHAALSARP